MKKKISARRPSRRFNKQYEFIDFRKRKVCTNNLAAENTFGSQDLSPKLLKNLKELFENPDWYYAENSRSFKRYYYSKYIGRYDYIVAVGKGYGQRKNVFHIAGFKKISLTKIEQDVERFPKPLYVAEYNMLYCRPGAAKRNS